MAELVDALVSNTSGAIRAGSIPALGTKIEQKPAIIIAGFFYALKLSAELSFCTAQLPFDFLPPLLLAVD